MIPGDHQDDSSVLDRRARGRVFLLRCFMYANGCRSALAWGLILYVLAYAFSNVSHAAIFYACGGVTVHSSQSAAQLAAQGYDHVDGSATCTTGGSCTGGGTGTSSVWGDCNQPDTGALTPSFEAFAYAYMGRKNGVEDPADSGDFRIDLFFHFYGTGCPTGMVDNGSGICEEDLGPCHGASADDAFNSTTQDYNPGLCELGDVAYSNEQVCAYSETAGENCEANLIEDITLDSLLPPRVTINSALNFTTTPCTTVSTPDPYEFESCDEPPPTCPLDQAPVLTGGEWVCKPVDQLSEVPPDEDLEPVPDGPTAGPEVTTTTTTTTTTNPDGSTTSTSTTTTGYGPCPEGETCTSEMDYEGPGDRVGEVKTFGQSLTGFLEGAQETPIMTAADGIADAIPSSSTCPTWTSGTIPLINTTITLDGHCLAIEGQEETIRTIMLVAWGIAGLFILLSA